MAGFDIIYVIAAIGFIVQVIILFAFFKGIKRLETRQSSYFKNVGGKESSDKEEEIKRVLVREHQRTIEELEEKFRDKQIQTSTLFIKIKAITSTLDSSKIIKEIMDILKKDIQVLQAVIFLKDEKNGKFFPAELLGIELTDEEKMINFTSADINVLTIAMEKRNIISAEAFHQDPRLSTIEKLNPLFDCKMAVPLVAETSSIGVIAIKEMGRELETDDMRLLSAISTLTGMAISNASDLESSKMLSEEQLRERKKLEGIFSKYVSASVVDQLLTNPDMQVLGGKKQKVTIMFCDIRGFTSMSEQMEPEEIVDLLNVYFTAMSDLIFTYNGTLDKFMGDAIMALYGAPIINPDDALRAVTTAIEMQRAVKNLNEARAIEGKTTIKMGIGLNTGVSVVGNVGSEQRLEYTAIGDSVNIASRLCSAAKGGQVLISESTFMEIVEMIDVSTLPPIQVKGKTEPVKIYQVNKMR